MIRKNRENNRILSTYSCSWFSDRRVYRRTNYGQARRPGPSSAGGSRHSWAVWRLTDSGRRERQCSWPSWHRLWPARTTARVRWTDSSWCLCPAAFGRAFKSLSHGSEKQIILRERLTTKIVSPRTEKKTVGAIAIHCTQLSRAIHQVMNLPRATRLPGRDGFIALRPW